MQIINYIVYIKADESGRIIAVNSSAFLLDTAGWTEIDAGLGDKYHHAQGNYFQQPLYDEQGCHNYIYDGTVRPATAEKRQQSWQPDQSWNRQILKSCSRKTHY